jgi:hypothetical protein
MWGIVAGLGVAQGGRVGAGSLPIRQARGMKPRVGWGGWGSLGSLFTHGASPWGAFVVSAGMVAPAAIGDWGEAVVGW